MKQIAFALVAFLVPVSLFGQGLTLATRGQPAAYTIVRPANASPSQIYAAEEFQKFTEQMTGVRLPIVADDAPLPERAILIGDTRHTARILGVPVDLKALGEDGFRLKTCPPHLLILGGPARGTLYGVYETLEHFGGCRWYTTWHSIIPERDAWTIPPIDDTQTPAFAMREPFWYDMFDGDLAARNKANGNAMRLIEKHGGKIRFGGGLFVHTFNTLCPPEEYFADHPEYFSEIEGRRTADRAQLCLTNPDVVRIVTGRLLERIRKDPGARLFSVSQNDWHNCCACPSCKAVDDREESHAGTLIAFVNQVAEAVEKEFPGVWIETLAYQYTRKPPKTIRPRRNVVPRLCTIECDFSKPLDASAHEQNRKFVEEIRAWGAMTDKLYIWDYTTNFRDYVGPFPNVLALQENVKFFRDNHVMGLFEQGAYQGRHGDFAELKAWLLAKWLWDPDLPAGQLLDDFFAGYYGAAAPLVRQYFDEVHAFYRDPERHLRISDDLRKAPITDEFYARATLLWRQAEAAVGDDSARAYNARMGAIPVLYARLARLPAFVEQLEWTREGLRASNVPAEHRALAADLLSRFREAKNIRISESSERHENTLAAWTRWTGASPYLSVASKGLRADASPEFGGIVGGLARQGDDFNFLCGAAGGIGIHSASGPFGDMPRAPFKQVRRTADTLVLEHTGDSLKNTRDITVGTNGLRVACALLNARAEGPAAIRPVTRVALSLGENSILCWRVPDGGWQTWRASADTASETLTLTPSQVPGSAFDLAAPATRRGVSLSFEGAPKERYSLVVDRASRTVTLFAPEAAREIPPGGEARSAVTVRPLTIPEGLPPATSGPMTRTVIEDWLLRLGKPGVWGEYSVADPGAEDGSAMRLNNTHFEWCTTLPFDHVKYEPGARYRIRMRARVEKEPGKEGEAFWAGVYDTGKKKSHGGIDRKTAVIGEGYAWYDVAEWTPEADHYFWVGPGRFGLKGGSASAIKALFIDKIELMRVD